MDDGGQGEEKDRKQQQLQDNSQKERIGRGMAVVLGSRIRCLWLYSLFFFFVFCSMSTCLNLNAPATVPQTRTFQTVVFRSSRSQDFG